MGKSKRPSRVLEEVLEFNAGRKHKYLRLKLDRMQQDVFAFFRGSDHLFAANWPKLSPPDPGPSILICGDLHLENFGGYRTEGGKFLFDVNDYDEAVVGPCSLDLVRCATSILLASDMWKRTPLEATRMALEFLERYRAVVMSSEHRNGRHVARLPLTKGPILKLLGKAAVADEKSLLDKHTARSGSGERKIVVSEEKHPAISASKRRQIEIALERYGSEQPNPDFFRVLDVTGRILGIGSLGVRRYLVLVAGGGSRNENRLLDLKEARPSAVLSAADADQPAWGAREADRVVGAQQVLQGAVAAGLAALTVGRRDFRLREMIPEENRPRIDRFKDDPVKLLKVVQTAGELTAALHLRGARFRAKGRTAALAKWAAGPALDSVLAAAARHAERTVVQFQEFKEALSNPATVPKWLRASPQGADKTPRG